MQVLDSKWINMNRADHFQSELKIYNWKTTKYLLYTLADYLLGECAREEKGVCKCFGQVSANSRTKSFFFHFTTLHIVYPGILISPRFNLLQCFLYGRLSLAPSCTIKLEMQPLYNKLKC